LVIVGALAAVVGALFVSTASTTYSPIDSESIVNELAALLQQPADKVREALATVADQLGPYTKIGAGPWIVIAGGVLVAVGGVLTVRWAARLSADRAAADEVGASIAFEEPPDDHTPATPDARDDDAETSLD
jgi:hypothetical protein